MKRYFALLLFVYVSGCNVNELEFDNLDVSLTGDYAAPLGTISYTVEELLLEGSDSTLEFTKDSTQLISLVFRDTAEFDSGGDIISIGNITNSTIVDLPETPANPGPDPLLVQIDTTIVFEYPSSDNDPVDSIFYESGTLAVGVASTVASTSSYTLTIANTINLANGDPVSFSESTESSISLANHKSSLLQNDSGVNIFNVDFSYTVTLQPGEEIRAGDRVNLSVDYLDQTFNLLYGNFGQDTLQVGEEIIDIDFFEDLGDQGFIFFSPSLTMDFTNSFGLPMGFLFNNFYSVKNSDTTYLRGGVTAAPQVVDGPGVDSVGFFKESRIVINQNNSTFPDLLRTSPGQIGLDLQAVANPVDTSRQNFVLDTSRIQALMEIELPMILQLNEVSRDVEFDLGQGLEFDQIDSASIRIVAINSIPFYVLLDMFFLDEDSVLIYENLNNRVIDTPFLNIDGSLKQPRKNVADVNLSPAGIEALMTASSLVMRVYFNTPESQTSDEIYVRLLADASIDLTISAQITLSPDF